MPLDEKHQIGQIAQDLEELELPSENDLMILKAIGEDVDSENLSFQGIKRKLGLHQETLSRALHRLQRDGYVEHLEHAYRISPKGILTISQGKIGTQPNKLAMTEAYSISLLRAMLPADVNVRDLVESLSYKWFGNLRWLGSTQTADSATLNWITDDTGLKISVKIKDDSLTIETYPNDSYSITEATRSAFELFGQISRALKSSGRSGLSDFPKAA